MDRLMTSKVMQKGQFFNDNERYRDSPPYARQPPRISVLPLNPTLTYNDDDP
jgi:hypothetical protein